MSGRILFVIGSLERGGAEQHIARIAPGLKARGWKPELFVFTPGGPLTAGLEAAGVPIHAKSLPARLEKLGVHPRIKAWSGLAVSMKALHRLLRRENYDAVHFFLPAAYILGGMASLLAHRGARIMSRRSRNYYQSKHKLMTDIELRLHGRMDAVCGNSQAVIDDLRAEGVDEEKLALIYNGIDITRFERAVDRPAVRRTMGAGPDDILLVCVANIIPYKGHADLIEALAILSKRADMSDKAWRLACIGRDDGHAAVLIRQARAAGLDDRISFLGSRDDVDTMLLAADIGVLASHEEGFSNAVLEKAAAGLPVVATDVGGNGEVIVEDEMGLVVPPRSPQAFADALATIMLRGQDERRGMGARARERAALFSLASCLDKYEALYQRVLTRDSGV